MGILLGGSETFIKVYMNWFSNVFCILDENTLVNFVDLHLIIIDFLSFVKWSWYFLLNLLFIFWCFFFRFLSLNWFITEYSLYKSHTLIDNIINKGHKWNLIANIFLVIQYDHNFPWSLWRLPYLKERMFMFYNCLTFLAKIKIFANWTFISNSNYTILTTIITNIMVMNDWGNNILRNLWLFWLLYSVFFFYKRIFQHFFLHLWFYMADNIG